MAASSTSFKPGNTAAVKHGLRSQRIRAENRQALLQEQHDLIRGRLPDLTASDAFLVDLLADALADVVQIRTYINDMGGPISPRGQLRKPTQMYRERTHDAISLLDRLGVGPKARAAIFGSTGPSNNGRSLAAQLADYRATQPALTSARAEQ